MADDPVQAARDALDNVIFTMDAAGIDRAIDALIAAVRAEGTPDPTRTPGCDCDQSGNPERTYHAIDCNWRTAS